MNILQNTYKKVSSMKKTTSRLTGSLGKRFYHALRSLRSNKGGFLQKTYKKVSRPSLPGSRTTRLGIVLVLILILAPIFYLSMKYQPATEAAWFDDSYGYRKQITFTNSSNAIYSARKVLVEVDTATLISNGKMQSSCQDARFTNQNGKVLRYFIDSDAGDCNTASTDFYVEVQQVHSAPNVLYFYYGNPAASSGASNEFFAPSGALSGIGDSLKGFWSLEETSGTRYDRAHTNELTDNATVVGTSAGDNTTVADFEKDNSEYLSIADNADLSGGDADFTIGAWVKLESSSNIHIAGKWDAPRNVEYSLVYRGNRFRLHVGDGSPFGSTDFVVINDSAASLNRWYFVVAWHKDGKIYGQVDNGTVYSATSSVSLGTDDTAFTIGSTDNGGDYMDGNIANVGFWKRTLSAEERAALYNSGRGTNYSDLTAGEIPALVGITQDLKAYWNLDETSGTRADSHGSNDLTDNNTVTSVSGKIGGAGDFEADNSEYLSIADNSDLSINGSDFTVASWVYMESEPTANTIMARRVDSTNGEFTLVYDQSSDKFVFYPMPSGGGSGQTIEADNFGTVTTNTWYFVTAWWDESEQTGSISINNGTADSEVTGFGIGDVVTQTKIGAQQDTPMFHMDGVIDNTMFWKRTLTAAERTALYNNGNGVDFGTVTYSPDSGPTLASEEQAPEPVAYWAFDEAQGQAAQDGTTNNNDGTLGSTGGSDSNDPTWVEESRCINGPCLEFDGSDDYVDMGDKSVFDGSGEFTWSAWVRPNDISTSISNVEKIFYKAGSVGDRAYQITFSSSASILCDVDCLVLDPFQNDGSTRDNSVAIPTSDINENQWHFISFSYSVSGNASKAFLDGVEVDSVSVTESTGFKNTTANLYVGGNESGATFNGFIDEVKIYPYARSAAEIKNDYLKGAASAGSGAVLGAHNTANLSDGLVGYWKMDDSGIDTEGESITDSSGNSNSGTLYGDDGTGDNGSGMDCTATGQFGTGCDFDGTDDYVKSTNNISINGASERTLSYWINPTSLSNTHIIGWGDDAVTGEIWYSLISSGNWYLWAKDSEADWNTGVSAETGWQHHVITYDGSTAEWFIDGISIGTNDNTINTTVAPLVIGKRHGQDNNYFTGTIDDVRIYNRALSPAEVRQLYNFAPGPVAHWKMDDGVSGSGATITDASSYSNNGTTAGSNIDCTKPGKFGKACDFNGTDDYVDVGSSVSLTDTVTMTAWVNIDGAGGNSFNRFVSYDDKNDDGQNSFTLRWDEDDDKRGVFVRGDTGGIGNNVHVDASGDIALNEWIFIAATWDGSTVIYYEDGVQLASDSYSTPMDDTNASIAIGTRSDGFTGDVIDGQIDDVRIYNYALTQKQITNVMNGRSVNDSAVGSPVGHAVGEWNFDEGYGTTANDTGTGGNNGTLTNMASPATSSSGWQDVTNCKVGKCLAFDGSDDYMKISDPADDGLDFGTGDFSMSAWVNVSSSAGSAIQTIMSKKNSGATGSGYAMWVNTHATSDHKIRVGIADGSTGGECSTDNTNVVSDDTWEHVVGLREDGEIKIYVNGVEQAASGCSRAEDVSTAHPFGVGHHSNTNNFHFTGKIDQPRIYNYALTEDEVKLEYNLGASQVLGHETGATETGLSADDAGNPPVAEWKMDELTSGASSLQDTSGNGNTGTITGATVKTAAECKIGRCLDFDGSDDYVDMGNVLNGLDDGDYTFTGWVKLNSLGSYQRIHAKRSVSNTGYGFRINSSNQLEIAHAGVGTFSSTQTLPADTWVFVAAIYDKSATQATLYVDNSARSGSLGIMGDPSGESFQIGQNSGLGSFFNGSIDQVKIWDRALSQKEIAYEYNGGAPIAHWKFDECSGTTVHSTNTEYDSSLNGTITAGASGTNTSAGSCDSGNGDEMWDNGTTGKYGGSLDFDGTDDYVSVGDDDKFSFGDGSSDKPFSVSAWVNMDDATKFRIVTKSGINNTDEWAFTTDLNDKLGLFLYDDVIGQQIFTNSTSLTFYEGQWVHVVATYNGSGSETGIQTFFNGTNNVNFSNSAGSYTAMHDSSAEVHIGSLQSDAITDYANGQIDDVRIYNYALSADEVRKVYNQGSSIRFGD